MDAIERAREFVAETCDFPDALSLNEDILRRVGITGDDADDFMLDFSERFGVDLSDYRWYFHSEEEGYSIGSLFFKSPDRMVSRIPITLEILAASIELQRWSVDYPDHDLPSFRKDTAADWALMLSPFILVFVWIVLN